jgi:hypothetical protein
MKEKLGVEIHVNAIKEAVKKEPLTSRASAVSFVVDTFSSSGTSVW